MSLLVLSQLAKAFGVDDIFATVSVSLPQGARVALVGPNGAGKTTLLRHLYAHFRSLKPTHWYNLAMVSTPPTLETLKQVLRRSLPAGYQAVLFGSRATGTARPNSDWDIGILGPTELPLATAGNLREAF